MNIPFVDLKSQYLSIKDEIDSAIQNVVENATFIKGNEVTEFERRYAEIYGSKNCISVGNGTDSLYIILKMLGVGVGDEVITVANSWISSSEVISQTGATPVFVDVNTFYTLDVELLEGKVSSRTKAIIPVHLYGQPVRIDTILEIANKHGLHVVEDCAQSHFAKFKNKNVGLFGIASSFSFFPGKNLGAYGDAGCILTDDDDLAEKCRMYANHGALVKHEHKMEGINSRMDGLQAAVLNVKLNYILEWTRLRREKASYYSSKLKMNPNIEIPEIMENAEHVFHLYVIKAQKRDQLRRFLKENGVSAEIHYPAPLPFLPAYDKYNFKETDFPVAKKNQNLILSLPIYPEITEIQMDYVVSKIEQFYEL